MKIHYALLSCLSLFLGSKILQATFNFNDDTNIEKIETSSFAKADDDFWVIKDRAGFLKASKYLISDEGEWRGLTSVPKYVQYTHELKENDLPLLEKWLKLKEIECFAISNQKLQPNVGLISSWLLDLQEQEVDLKQKGLYKLAWLNYRSTLSELERGDASLLPMEWIETNRAYQMKNSHYREPTKLVQSH